MYLLVFTSLTTSNVVCFESDAQCYSHKHSLENRSCLKIVSRKHYLLLLEFASVPSCFRKSLSLYQKSKYSSCFTSSVGTNELGVCHRLRGKTLSVERRTNELLVLIHPWDLLTITKIKNIAGLIIYEPGDICFSTACSLEEEKPWQHSSIWSSLFSENKIMVIWSPLQTTTDYNGCGFTLFSHFRTIQMPVISFHMQ